MQEISTPEWITLAAICFAVALIGVFFLMPSRTRKTETVSIYGDAVWIFDDFGLVDATTRARKLINLSEGSCDWSDLHDRLADKFPGFPKSAAEIGTGDAIVAQSPEGHDPEEVFCERIDGLTRVHLRQTGAQSNGTDLYPLTESLEMETLRAAINNAHYPVWRVERTGEVTWFNAAYEKLCESLHGRKPDPQTTLFPTPNETPIPTKKARHSLTLPDTGKKLWFDVSVVQNDVCTLCYAVDINAVVDAEIAQRNFVQTLAKTFAQLSIGLAIFDRNRQLVLFNPALIDLTALPADFLSARPTLLSFFDRLRDQRMVPEPKNYNSWRDQIADLVAAAADGRYQETWSLPSGSVYSVSGRPHPDGAVAFLFKDITAEITLTRRFRSDLELGQAIFDRLDDAIAVFSLTGDLVFSNASYHKLWNVDPERSFAQTTILDAVRTWQDGCLATPVWGDIRDFVATQENRAEWWGKVTLRSRDDLICSVHPIQSGATMVHFTRPSATPTADPQTALVLAAD